jgi:antitoxin HicB
MRTKTLNNAFQHESNKGLEYYMRLAYPIVIYPPAEADEGWFAEIPDLPGCMTQTDSEDAILAMIDDAKRTWIISRLEHGDFIPEPTRD